MRNIRTVNMIWEQKFRGAYPVSRYALDETGTLAVAIPRPLEVRAFDLTRLSLDGKAEICGGFAVETLLKLDVTQAATDALGMTGDAVYLFHAGNKVRFQEGRRLIYIEGVLSGDGRYCAAAFSDMAGASYAGAYGEIGGRVCWTRDVDVPVAALALSRDGSRIALGAEVGTLWLLDTNRRDLWEFGQEEPVRALACSTDGAFTAYGTKQGAVGLIDSEGSRRWEAHLAGEIFALALSGDGSLCVALSRPPDEPGIVQLTCLIGQGQVGWQYTAEKRLLGLALSADGRYLATGARDGTLTVYEVIPGEAASGAGGQSDSIAHAFDHYRSLSEAGELEAAYQTLKDALLANPSEVEFAAAVHPIREQWLEARLDKARQERAVGDYAGALETLRKALAVEPSEPRIVGLLETVSTERAEQLLADARTEPANSESAEAQLLEAVAVAPFCIAAREELRNLRVRRAQEAAQNAARLLAEGDLEAGVAALEQAQAIAPDAERAAQLERAQVAQEFALGMAHYDARRYREAIFQFKKVLVRDPDHTDANRYLGYAQNFAQDAANDSLSDRFSRLE